MIVYVYGIVFDRRVCGVVLCVDVVYLWRFVCICCCMCVCQCVYDHCVCVVSLCVC